MSNEKIKTLRIDFSDEGQLILKWREYREKYGDRIVLIDSCNHYSEGYWIEEDTGQTSTRTDKVQKASIADHFIDAIEQNIKSKSHE